MTPQIQPEQALKAQADLETQKSLVRGKSQQEVAAMLYLAQEAVLQEVEDAKDHGAPAWTPEQRQANKAYMCDGGGVTDEIAVLLTVWRAIDAEDWVTYDREVFHLVKVLLRKHGLCEQVGTDGAVLKRGLEAVAGDPSAVVQSSDPGTRISVVERDLKL